MNGSPWGSNAQCPFKDGKLHDWGSSPVAWPFDLHHRARARSREPVWFGETAKLLCLSGIVRYPCHCSGSGGQSQSTDREHCNVINFLCRDPSLACASDCRMGSAFQSSSKRQGKFDQPSALLIQRASFVTALSQVIERFPYFRMALAELVYRFRQFLRRAGYLLPR